ncbi:MAG: carboxypeptidase-like regulatory domain-containing protein [Deltaproteobacteria bacterium]|nr:carboxypeptidase-like regulatory domain-containing protein [Deltaproteobacteria bacterium]
MKMRWTIPTLCLALLLPACGEWRTDLFEDGEADVRGWLVGSYRAESAWVGVMGAPETFVRVEADGSFALEDLPTGTFDLVASDGEGSAAVLEGFELYNRRDREDVEVPMEAGVRVDGQVLLSDGNVLWAQIRLPGFPAEMIFGEAEVTEEDGRFELRGLPWLPLDVELSHPGYGSSRHRITGEGPGDRLSLTVTLGPAPTGTGASCEPCQDASDCASGLCIEGESGGGSGGGGTCALLCFDDLDCPGAYTCSSLEGSLARICRPKDASCPALRATVEHRNCGSDEACGEGGLCLDGFCTLECSDDLDCPGGGSCRPHSSEPVDICE